jgi:hypothetical protein
VKNEFARNDSHGPVLGIKQETNPGASLGPSWKSPPSGKRVHEPARPTADDAVRPADLRHPSPLACVLAALVSAHRQVRCRRGDIASERFLGGSLIHNGNCRPPASIGQLTIPLIQSSFGTFAMTTVRSSTLLAPRLTAATVAAILLAPITATADPEDRAALSPPANPLTEKIFSRWSHSRPKARLDKRHRMWQLNGGCLENLSPERCCQWTPIADTVGVSSAQPSAQDYTKMMSNAASATRMMLRVSTPAWVQKSTVSDDR